MGALLSLLIVGYFVILSSFEVRVLGEVTSFFTGRHPWVGYYHAVYVGEYLFELRRYKLDSSSV